MRAAHAQPRLVHGAHQAASAAGPPSPGGAHRPQAERVDQDVGDESGQDGHEAVAAEHSLQVCAGEGRCQLHTPWDKGGRLCVQDT